MHHAQPHKAMATTPAQRMRLLERAEAYAEQLVAEGRDPSSARRDALQAYGLEDAVARRPLGPDLPREARRALLEHLARANVAPDLPSTRSEAARKSSERAARRVKAQGVTP